MADKIIQRKSELELMIMLKTDDYSFTSQGRRKEYYSVVTESRFLDSLPEAFQAHIIEMLSYYLVHGSREYQYNLPQKVPQNSEEGGRRP